MLVVIAGGDSLARAEARRRYARAALEELDGSISVEEIAAMAGTPTLTGESRAFLLRNVLNAKKEGEEGGALRDELPELAEGLVVSPHLFLLEEEKAPLKAASEKFKKAGATVELLEAKQKKEPFNIFDLANALARRDKKTLWLGLQRAAREGVAPENIAGVLAWKARTALSGARTPKERDSLAKLSRDLVALYHDSHRGVGDLELLLERFALKL